MILGITGKLGAGKTLAAEYLKAKSSHSLIQPLAKKLKDIAKDMGWDGNKDEKGRRLLQLIGTECGRECIGEDVWVNCWVKEITDWMLKNLDWDYRSNEFLVIADDVRFDNEASKIIELGGKILEIRGRHYQTPAALAHASEAGLDEMIPRIVVWNNGTIEEFYKKLDTVYRSMNHGIA